MEAALLNDIKYNCDISDAQFWGYFSVCGLLMRYRDLYRSERGLKPWSEIDREGIMSWIAGKESKWPDLELQPFRDLTIREKKFQPFDVPGINEALREQNLVYGAGYGMYLKPTFFLAELRSVREVSGLTVYTSGTEHVRDLFSSPGMLQEQSIFLRLEPLAVLLLYKFSELNVKQVAALEDAFARYGFKQRQIIDQTFAQRLELMAERYAEVLLCHEIAEAMEEAPEWKDILTRAADRKVELYLRAIQDLVADTSDHGPYRKIIETRDRGALSLTIALRDGYQKVLYPEIKGSYEEFVQHEDWLALEQVRSAGYQRLRLLRDSVVDLFRNRNGDNDFNGAIRDMLK